MQQQDKLEKYITLLKDKDQKKDGKNIIWVCLWTKVRMVECLNRYEPHTDLELAKQFARDHALKLGVEFIDKIPVDEA